MTTHAPKRVAVKLQKVIDAWAAIRPLKSFSELTLEQFKAQVQPSLATRDQLTTLKSQRTDSLTQRRQSDEASLALAHLVINAVKGDSAEGENGSLYAAMGYIQKSQRRSGLTRKGQTTTPSEPVAATPPTTTTPVK